MTAIGAMAEGTVDETEVGRRVRDMDPRTLATYAADVRQWIVGPYTGATVVDELRVRACVLVDIALGEQYKPIPGSTEITPVAPGSVDDPAYSSPSPAPGPEGLTHDLPTTGEPDPTGGLPVEPGAGTAEPEPVAETAAEPAAEPAEPAEGEQ